MTDNMYVHVSLRCFGRVQAFTSQVLSRTVTIHMCVCIKGVSTAVVCHRYCNTNKTHTHVHLSD